MGFCCTSTNSDTTLSSIAQRGSSARAGRGCALSSFHNRVRTRRRELEAHSRDEVAANPMRRPPGMTQTGDTTARARGQLRKERTSAFPRGRTHPKTVR